MYNKKKYLVALSSILLLQSLSLTCLSSQKVLLPEHPYMNNHDINRNKNKSTHHKEIKNPNHSYKK